MSESANLTRREMVAASAAVFGGLLSGCRLPRPKTSTASGNAHFSPEQDFAPTLAISLTAVGLELAKGGMRVANLRTLGGLNSISGALAGDDGEAILAGRHAPDLPALEASDVAVALRSAFGIGPESAQAPGCTIDPREGEEDPWRVQQVTVTGLPPRSAMAARFVKADYDLKKAMLGLVELRSGLTSLFEQGRAAAIGCGAPRSGEKETVHRFWFCPRAPESPRYLRAAGAIWIRRPVGVQVLTEREFRDPSARRMGTAKADPLADGFARQVTKLLEPGQLSRYNDIRADFRLLEATKLVAMLGVAPGSLLYFLEQHMPEQVDVPRFLGGLWREESGEIVCDNAVGASAGDQGSRLESRVRVHQYRQRVVGGVEARIEISKRDFAPGGDGVRNTARAILAARPSQKTAVWKVPR